MANIATRQRRGACHRHDGRRLRGSHRRGSVAHALDTKRREFPGLKHELHQTVSLPSSQSDVVRAAGAINDLEIGCVDHDYGPTEKTNPCRLSSYCRNCRIAQAAEYGRLFTKTVPVEVVIL
ncbi:protein of unknown function [Ralstonia solanacearum CFBP2957]|nr:protein of unknown function [Ralstonia solanacearum CFBP2957]